MALYSSGLSAQDLHPQFDKLLLEKYGGNRPGAAVLAMKGEEVIYRKAFGMANMELGVPMTADHVFEIGSITKQFTAVGILILLEEGKLSLYDEITKFIPDYPTQDHPITIHHLLNHTSGIKSYTSMNIMAIARQDMSPTELIDFFKNEPMDFNPGDEYRYNNSGYILLGYIIEKLSGMTYEDFVEQRIFSPAGMAHSRYGHKSELIVNRASGYQKADSFSNAAYLSMTLPYAAGSLMSTVDDLAKWQKALRDELFVKQQTLQNAYTDHPLNNGKPSYYGYGFRPSEINGTATIEHGGGIFGYTSYQIYIPEEELQVVILTNCNCNSPTDITVQLAALAIGKPYHYLDQVTELPSEIKESLVGVYDYEDNVTRFITLEEGQLYSQREGSSKLKIYPTDKETFYFEGGFTKLHFDLSTEPISVTFHDRGVEAVKGAMADRALPAEKVAIEVAPEVLARYEGTYEIQPGFNLTVTVEDGSLVTQATGQPKAKMLAETQVKFFMKEVPSSLEFVIGEDGRAMACILYQGTREIKALRKP
ncbi:MAG: serine hydrolase [Cyclobacteriaceae bacterium]|nr:serine hydrolase [Cyclobacteriaceae bacterium]